MQKTPPFPRRDRPVAFLAGALVAFLHPLLYGYSWGGGDQDDLIPPILARLNTSLFSNDAYVQGQLDGLTIRAAYQAVLTGLGRFISPEAAVSLLHVLTLIGAGAMVFALARAMHARRSASLLASVLACLVLPRFTLGGNHLVYSMLTPEGIAWVGALAAITIYLKEHVFIAALVLGVTCWFHPLVGFLTLIVLGVVSVYEVFKEEQEKPKRTAAQEADYQMDYVLGRGRQRRKAWKGWPPTTFIGGTLLIALPVVGPAILRQSASGGGDFPAGLNAFKLYVELRHPHHLLPSAFGAVEWISFLVLVAIGVGGYVLAARERRVVRLLFPTLLGATFLALAIVATYAIYEFDSLAIARAQVFKLTVLVNVALCIGIAAGALSLLQNDARRKLDDLLRKKAPLYIAAAVLCFLGFRDVRTPEVYDTRGVARWAQRETPASAVFLVPPSMDTFRVPSRRNVVVTWKSVPFRADLGAGWWARISDIAPLGAVPDRGRGLVEALDVAYASNSDEQWRALAEKYNAEYAIVPAGTESSLPVAETSGAWSILDLR
ncbi:DUF6798 domain-containing protein [Rubricoccus marinus]|uniref:DUF6798 domain-containing protein n=1 Tax=Rubricoccus marinus TaxID=716817 RepID=A0A259TZZ8_9BACT|nr:DUF6798 domain-containing protein [Rubricoccus marinus]OZC03158.1 hypothetical protein BSZ36_09335 [Rubricoccus marinus]